MDRRIDARTEQQHSWIEILPLVGCESFVTEGFSDDAKRYFADHFSTMVEGEIATADILVVNGVNVLPGSLLTSLGGQRVVCVRASKKTSGAWFEALLRTYPIVKRYGLLPSHKPRVVVPITKSVDTRVALRMHRPGRSSARLAINILSGLARLGLYRPLLKEAVIVATSKVQRPLGCRGQASSDRRDWQECAAYLGTDEEDRKTVVLPLDQGVADSVSKIAIRPLAVAALSNEIAALQQLGATSVAAYIPRLLDVERLPRRLVMRQEYRTRIGAMTGVSQASAAEFLGKLSHINRGVSQLDSVLPTGIMSGADAAAPSSSFGKHRNTVLQKLLSNNQDASVWMHPAHNDFTPWNCIATRSGIFVFDWERFSPRAIALGDAFHFVLSKWYYLEGGRDFSRALQRAHAFAIRVAHSAGLPIADVSPYFELWLLTGVSGALGRHLLAAYAERLNG